MIALTVLSLSLNVVSLILIRKLWVRVDIQDIINDGFSHCLEEMAEKNNSHNETKAQ